MALGDRLCASRANTASQRHITADATEEILCGGPHKTSQNHCRNCKRLRPEKAQSEGQK